MQYPGSHLDGTAVASANEQFPCIPFDLQFLWLFIGCDCQLVRAVLDERSPCTTSVQQLQEIFKDLIELYSTLVILPIIGAGLTCQEKQHSRGTVICSSSRSVRTIPLARGARLTERVSSSCTETLEEHRVMIEAAWPCQSTHCVDASNTM